MQRKDIEEQIRKFIVTRFPRAQQNLPGNDTSLLGHGVIDSLGILDVVTFLEQEFLISVADEDLLPQNFQSIAHISIFVQQKRENELPIGK